MPESWQAGEYFYDSQGRLERFEHISTYTGTPVTTIRKEYSYGEDGRTLGHDSFVNLDGQWFHSRAVRYHYQDSSLLPAQIELADVDELTGQVFREMWSLVYSQHGQLVQILRGSDTETYMYDRRGDVIRVLRENIRSGTIEERLTYSSSWNPFAGLPPLHGAFSGILFPGEYSLHLTNSFQIGIEGQPRASEGVATVATNTLGYPTRWEVTFWNTSDPDNKSTAVTEYEYYEQ